ncbi:MAG: DsrE family protein [Deltaproteobacteria bacterium]|nr:DsrE family protein [Deltaproteobacteria bacterium]
MKLKISYLVILGFIILFPCRSAVAEEFANKRALTNISAVKAYYDVNIGIPAKLVTRLKLIDKTYEQLVSAGVTAEFVIGFRGKASYFVTKGDDYVFEEDIPAKKKVLKWIHAFKARGIIMEQCRIAASLNGVDPKDILPEIEVVQNGYISMIGYQAKGYSQIPMD